MRQNHEKSIDNTVRLHLSTIYFLGIMSAYLEKSKEYEVAATFVRESCQYNACMHNYYYSLILLATHFIVHRDGKSINDLITSQTVGDHKPTSHKVIRDQLRQRIKSVYKYDRFEQTSFNNNFNNLKALRESADYEDELLGSHAAQSAEKYLKELKESLKKVYR